MAQDHPFSAEQDRALRTLVSRQLRPHRAGLLLLAAALAGAALAGAGAVRTRGGGEARGDRWGELAVALSDLRARSDTLAAELDGLRAELESRGRDAAALAERLDEAEGALRSLESGLPPGEASQPRPSTGIAPILERLYNLELRHDALDRARESFERGVLTRLHNVETGRDRAEVERVTREQALLGRLANLEERLYGVETRAARGAPGAALPASAP